MFQIPDPHQLADPKWREYDKEKWTDKKGFVTQTRKNSNIGIQAWDMKKEGGLSLQPYQGGDFNTGHNFKPRLETKETFYHPTTLNSKHSSQFKSPTNG